MRRRNKSMSAPSSPADGASLLVASPGGSLRGDIAAPGDKSISHRALILGALAEGETRIEGLLESEDVLATAEALRAFGRPVVREEPGCWRVTGGEWRSPEGPIDCGNSGTAARLLMGAAAGFPISAVFDGDESLRRRPMRRVTDPLKAMGARFGGGDTLPLRLEGGALRGIAFRNDRASAQVKSAILLAGLRADGAVEVIEPSPSRDHSEIMLRAFGCEVETSLSADGTRIRLGERRQLRATEVTVPGDPSSAAFPLVAALIVEGSEVTVRNVLMNPLRAGLFDTLLEMRAHLRITGRRSVGGEEVADITARHSSLRGIEVLAERAPRMIDEYPILAAAAALAEGRTIMRGLGELRHKESDRIGGMVRGLVACGVDAVEEGNSLIVRGGGRPAGGAAIETEGDHRIAMSFLVLGLASSSAITVGRADMIATSFPGFAELMRGLGADLGAGS
jgi:3-phosphoshikimate 1-carboxyvinyltransferase